MDLLILDGQAEKRAEPSPPYRGTHRAAPVYCDELPKDHEVNRLFLWYIEEGGETGVVHDLLKALRLAELLTSCLPARHYEVVEVTDGTVAPTSKGSLLGFDISAGFGYSLLGGACLRKRPRSNTAEPTMVLHDLVVDHFRPMLNEAGLFRRFEDAENCLHAMRAMQHLRASLYESGDLSEFRSSGVYIVSAIQ